MGEYVDRVETFDSGGHVLLDLVHLHDGRVLGISGELVALYANVDALLTGREPLGGDLNTIALTTEEIRERVAKAVVMPLGYSALAWAKNGQNDKQLRNEVAETVAELVPLGYDAYGHEKEERQGPRASGEEEEGDEGADG